jgi:isopenicillin N synthase-like dioxygenase
VTSAPIIDISTLRTDTGDPAAAHEIHAACLETGFFVVVGHGLDEPMADVFAAARSFFDQPQAVKELTPRRDRYGYVPRAAEALDRDRRTGGTGQTEFLDMGLRDEIELPALPGFESTVREYQRSALGVGIVLFRVLAEQLGAPSGYFAERMSRPQCRLRFLHYAPLPADGGGALAVPTTSHTDYGGLTLLATDGVPGLEVRPIDAAWIPVEAPPGSLVVNLGDMLARWTNDVYRSTPHRVVATTDRHRYSIPFFINPNADTIVQCVPSCVTEERPCGYEPITAGAYLAARIDSSAEPYVDPDDGPQRFVVTD